MIARPKYHFRIIGELSSREKICKVILIRILFDGVHVQRKEKMYWFGQLIECKIFDKIVSQSIEFLTSREEYLITQERDN